MKFNFKIQQYQTEAVMNTVEVFTGQPSVSSASAYRRDLGKTPGKITFEEEYLGYRNNDIELDSDRLLANIKAIQARHDIRQSASLSLIDGLGRVNLDIEMETGTGKTYVYIKTMFELNKHYGWNKFIVVVPSIAIREGVAKSFRMLEDHFMEHYGKKARWFVYDSGNLQKLDSYSSDAGINVMIINTQAFASSLKEGANNKESRIIYSKRDDFQSRRPIDVLAANRPIIIMDEPQKMEGAATQNALKKFRPLFMLYYSATHKTSHNTIYALDALDAYNKKLVKKIQVKGFEVKNLRGTSGYLYIDSIILSKNNPPLAKIEIEAKRADGTIRRQSMKFGYGDKLCEASGLAQYDGYEITGIDPIRGTVSFMNGLVLGKGQVVGDSNDLALKRVQIRETIVSHFEKERELFARGIKTLSLFFIDEVSKYKTYGEDGEVVPGLYWKIFEEEYANVLNDKLSLFDTAYRDYLLRFDVGRVHNGYFSIDKKGRSIDSKTGRGSDISDDISAYDLILKDKERLLSFDEPTRFIFSHSALREGWDNPNVFQICTLRHANSATAKRQEVGRGLRLCVDSSGNRMDLETLGEESVHTINKLTVIANESYETFVKGLQDETREVLRERPTKVTAAYFEGKTIKVSGENHTIDAQEAALAFAYFVANGYVDKKGLVTDSYKDAVAGDALVPMSMFPALEPMADSLHYMVQCIFDEDKALSDMVEDASRSAVENDKLNDNFYKAEFQALWKAINHKYAYTVHYDSEELIRKAITSIDANLTVSELKYVVMTGEQAGVDTFGSTGTSTKTLGTVCTSTVKYDLVGDIAREATLTRATVVRILRGIRPTKLAMFRNNPEEFIKNVVKLIKDEKATMIVEHISYNQIEGEYESDIFTSERRSQYIHKAYAAKKHILDYVFTDGLVEESTEKRFAKALDEASEVCVYAKLPRSFQIPTPVGNYAPDWAIAFEKGKVKHIFFIAETKGSLDSMELRAIERAKISCAKKLFNECSDASVRYAPVTTYQDLLDAVQNL